jgi:hypothetical protein
MITRQKNVSTSIKKYLTHFRGNGKVSLGANPTGRIEMETNRMELTDTQRNTISCGLRIAAERYDEHVETLRKKEASSVKYPSQLTQLAEMFAKQSADVRQLASLFDECESVLCVSCSPIESF